MKGKVLVTICALAVLACDDFDDEVAADAGADASSPDASSDATPWDSNADAQSADANGEDTPASGDMLAAPCVPAMSRSRLVSHAVATPPVLDGLEDDPAWPCASILQVTLDAYSVYRPEGAPVPPAYPGLGKTKITLKSVHTATDLYLIASWDDPTHSLARLPWEKQADLSWKQLSNKDSSKHDNTYYEDKLGIQWNIQSPSFSSVGCLASCHSPAGNDMPGKKYNKPGEVTDLWHWKSVRTEPNGQVDDGYVSDPTTGKCAGLNCRLSDGKTAGGYKDNNFAGFMSDCPGDPQGTGMFPCFMGPPGAEAVKDNRYWILDQEKQPFVDTFKPGDRVAAMVTAPFVGSRGEVSSRARYADGRWTLEMRRALVTPAGEAEDVQFNDLSKSYEFGVAIFDNSQINHASHETVLRLTFGP